MARLWLIYQRALADISVIYGGSHINDLGIYGTCFVYGSIKPHRDRGFQHGGQPTWFCFSSAARVSDRRSICYATAALSLTASDVVSDANYLNLKYSIDNFFLVIGFEVQPFFLNVLGV